MLTQKFVYRPNNNFFTRKVGKKHYELTDHLSNVRATITDRKIATIITDAGSGAMGVIGYSADITSAQDYYPFGWTMPGRQFDPGEYRYGFGGAENDSEISGVGNSLNFDERMNDTRIARWLSVDPLDWKYPSESPYTSMGLSPIAFTDSDGREIDLKTTTDPNTGRTKLTITLSGVVSFDELNTYTSSRKKKSYVDDLNSALKSIYSKNFEDLDVEFVSELRLGSNDDVNPDDHVVYVTNLQTGPHRIPVENAHGFVNQIGGRIAYFPRSNDFRTAAHEIGHWLGLLHPERYVEIAAAAGLNWDDINISPDNIMYQGGGGENFDKIQADISSRLFDLNSLNQGGNGFNIQHHAKHRPYPRDIIKGTFDFFAGGNSRGGSSNNSPTPSSGGSDCNARFCCFIAGTDILMANGDTKYIENVEVGDSVLTVDINTLNTMIDIVKKVASPIHKDIVAIKLSDGTVLKNTFDHSYFVKDKAWCSYRPDLTNERYGLGANQLEPGDQVYRYSTNNQLELVKVVSIVEEVAEIKTYNLFVLGENSNYFANGVLVHDESRNEVKVSSQMMEKRE